MDFTRSRTTYDDMMDFHKSCPLVGNTLASGTSALLITSVVSSGGAALLVTIGLASLGVLYKKLNASLYSDKVAGDKHAYFYKNLKEAMSIEGASDLESLSTSAQKNILSVAADLKIVSEDDLYTSRQSSVLILVYIRKVSKWMTLYQVSLKTPPLTHT